MFPAWIKRRETERFYMTEKQRNFIDEYLVDSDAVQAAVRAGYAVKNAARTAKILLQNPEIISKISLTSFVSIEGAEDVFFEENPQADITADMVARELWKIAILESDEKKQTERGSDVRTADRLKALELLGKHFGMFADKSVDDTSCPVVISGENELRE